MPVAMKVNGEITLMCEWFALCENPFDGLVEHPVLGPVPTCQRCADKAEQTITVPKDRVGISFVDLDIPDETE